MSMKMTKVLFVCLGNACRSPMAEAIARHDAKDVIEASSAGLTPLGRLETMTKQTLARNGYSAEGLESKRVVPEALENADIVVNMSGYAGEAAFDDHAKVEDWRVEDPYGADAELYQRIFEDIRGRIAELAERLRKGAHNTKRGANIKGKGSARD
ncbi:MAG: low molecular weight phosphatase family protein [Candidatus Acidiferrum sp.]